MEQPNPASPELEGRPEAGGDLPEGVKGNLEWSGKEERKGLHRPEEFLRVWGNPVPLEDTQRDNVRAFLSSFEQIAEACQWPRGEWVGRLRPALSSSAEQALGRLEAADREDYGKVKAAVLREDAVRMEAQRRDFRQFCYQKAGDPQRVYRQLRELCHRWLKPKRRSKEQIMDLLILEQFLAILPHELQGWVREEGPGSCAQAVALTEDFLKAETWKWQMPSQGTATRPLETDEASPDNSQRQSYMDTTALKCDEDMILPANGTTLPIHPCSLLPPEGLEVAEAWLTEGPASAKEKEEPFCKEEASLTQPGQRTMFWQVKEENCGIVGSLEGLLIPKLDLSFQSEKGEKMFLQEPEPGKRREIKMESSHPGEAVPEGMSQGNVPCLAEIAEQKRESKGHQETKEYSNLPEVPVSENTTQFGVEKLFSSYHGRNNQHSLGLGTLNAEEGPYECPVRGESFQRGSALAEHQRRHMGEELCEWSEGEKPFPQREIWVSHQSGLMEEKPYECPECRKGFSYRATLMRHRRIHTQEKPHKCSHCGKSFSQRTNLVSHLRIHTGERPYQCSQCGKGFRWQLHLKRHQKTHTGEKPHECPDCGKSFSRRDTLLNHRRTHTGEKPYECPDCGRNFNHPCNLIEHQKTHTGEKPHKCPECGKNFSRRDTLIKHQRTHTGEKPYECPECGKSFHHPCRLIDHQKIHTGEKPHECPECGKNFSRRDTLIKHQRTHAEEKPYECPECGKSFIQKKAFIRHQIIHLGNTSS
ncbi:finger 436-like isoform X1 [Podarcis lilfordi]|uniref:Finger 436-like isoform X1 n=1 Tax=Podarcis lilfordi TaxID=74358 RepID=A0AA35JYW0_9SAUR|nr:finger 436-like isoform X1 [Podarcis lilfordi]